MKDVTREKIPNCPVLRVLRALLWMKTGNNMGNGQNAEGRS